MPFNQRPNLDHNRCLVGPTTGVIAGNFIEQSESLQDVVDRGAGRAPLHSLFEGALRGWRRQAFYAPHYVIKANILQRMDLSRPSTYSSFRQARLGKRRTQNDPHCATYSELESLLAAMPPIEHRLGLTHGDLHGQNVRVAGHEAIMLDFASVADGPLTVDPAALDVSLMIDTRIVNGDDWIKVAEEAYKVEALMAPAIPPRPEDPCANLLDAIQYVRQMAFSVQLTPYEYPCVVALQLLRKASYGGTGDEQDRRRAFAYRLADRIIKDIARRIH
ncbi:phosphotransferase [Bradyrhizobium yuanmingense]|uniref:phosphotransferase n=1 Tax=Bradyrhizobium yuanmingense TaxID=108015 RepID=UPI0023B9889F|nr:phosphotransferase [Bradyrhizobium yuanmingense]MDF0498161.1 phosphotransferase [Bradyrhizobium yuanmingense]